MKTKNRRISAILGAIVCLYLLTQTIFASTETDFLQLVNAERASLGKSPLYLNQGLTSAAYLHSKDMAENSYFSHTSLDGRTFVQRIQNAGYTGYSSIGENLAYHSGAENAQYVFSIWKNSPGHYANMIGAFNEMGLGVYSKNSLTYYTMDMGKRPESLINKTTSPVPVPAPAPVPSPQPAKDTTPPVISVTSSKTLYSTYKLFSVDIKTDEPSTISYNVGSSSGTICRGCTRSRFYVRASKSFTGYLKLTAKDSSGNTATKSISLS